MNVKDLYGFALDNLVLSFAIWMVNFIGGTWMGLTIQGEKTDSQIPKDRLFLTAQENKEDESCAGI